MTAAWTDFIEMLVPSTAEGFINIRSFNDRTALPPRNHFIKANASDREAQLAAAVYQDMLENYDVYVALAERATPSGKKDACSFLRALFIDKDVVKEGADWGAALQQVFGFAPMPGVVINSGGGFHLYWPLRVPINLRVPGEIAKTESILRRLALALGGDKAATDVSRVLRVPGTFNLKPQYTKPLVSIAKFEPAEMI
jgi:hypothetical protein